jgi:hypothetical protein
MIYTPYIGLAKGQDGDQWDFNTLENPNTDKIDNKFQQIDSRLDSSFSDTGWKDIPLLNGISGVLSYRLVRQNGVSHVSISAVLTNISGNFSNIIGILPNDGSRLFRGGISTFDNGAAAVDAISYWSFFSALASGNIGLTAGSNVTPDRQYLFNVNYIV